MVELFIAGVLALLAQLFSVQVTWAEDYWRSYERDVQLYNDRLRQDAQREAERHTREMQRRYHEEAQRYAETPSYSNPSTWITTPDGKAMECIKSYGQANVVTCY